MSFILAAAGGAGKPCTHSPPFPFAFFLSVTGSFTAPVQNSFTAPVRAITVTEEESPLLRR